MDEWTVEFTGQFGEWFEGLTSEEGKASIRAAVRVLKDRGPTLGRPLVDRIESSRYHNMKELRPVATNIRILFAFDPQRTAILLLGGDKTGEWNRWYEENVPVADKLYAERLRVLADAAKETTGGSTGRKAKAKTKGSRKR